MSYYRDIGAIIYPNGKFSYDPNINLQCGIKAYDEVSQNLRPGRPIIYVNIDG
jgi:hypothetical protein